jgi:hypothetical protein
MYWCKVKGCEVGHPTKTTKGWLNSQYSLETNIQEVIVSQVIHPPNINPTSDKSVTSNAAYPPAADSLYSQHTPKLHLPDTHDNQPSLMGYMLVHISEEYTVPGSEATKSVMLRCPWSSIHDNERTINRYAMYLTMLTKKI